MKYEQLKKRVVIETGALTVIMIVMGAVIYLIGSISNDYAENNNRLQQEVDAVDSATVSLKNKYTNIQKNISDFKEVEKKLGENRLAINRQLILEKFNQFKAQFALNNLQLTVSSAADVKDGVLKYKNSSVNFSRVSVGFVLTTDESVYQLIDALRDELPGLSKPIKLTLTYERPFNQEAYHELSTKGVYPMVKGDLEFIWYGINYVPPETKPDSKANAPK